MLMTSGVGAGWAGNPRVGASYVVVALTTSLYDVPEHASSPQDVIKTVAPRPRC